MYSFPDTLFSCVDNRRQQQHQQQNQNDMFHEFGISSGMMQPTLDHLNPCFDELMDNFDFLFTDLSAGNAYQEGVNTDPPNMLLDNAAYR